MSEPTETNERWDADRALKPAPRNGDNSLENRIILTGDLFEEWTNALAQIFALANSWDTGPRVAAFKHLRNLEGDLIRAHGLDPLYSYDVAPDGTVLVKGERRKPARKETSRR